MPERKSMVNASFKDIPFLLCVLKTTVANQRLNETTDVVGDVEDHDMAHLVSGPSLQSDINPNVNTNFIYR